MHDGIGFLRVARTIVEYVTIGGITAQDIRACEGAEEQHPPLERVGHRDDRGRRSNISNEAEYLVFLVELFHGLDGPGRLIAIVSGDQPEHPAVHAPGVVDPIERGVDPELHLPPKFL